MQPFASIYRIRRFIENLRASSATTAVAVARAAADDGVATKKADDLVQAVQAAIWQPAYPDSGS